MRTRILLSLFALACLVPLAITPATAQQGPPPGGPGGRPGGGGGRPMMGPPLQLTSSAFTDGTMIPDKYTCSPDGKSMTQPANMTSPPLAWANPPAGTQSFVLLLHDPDAHARKQFDDITHWMIFNIPGAAHELPEGVPANATLSDGTIQAKNLRQAVGYMGPGAPAAGPEHHYTFELFALDTKLDLGPDATRADVLKAIDGHILGKGVLVGRFHR